MKRASHIEEVKALIAKGKTEEAIDALSHITDEPEFQNEVITIKSLYHRLNLHKLKGTMSSEQVNIENNRIIDSILRLLDQTHRSQSILSELNFFLLSITASFIVSILLLFLIDGFNLEFFPNWDIGIANNLWFSIIFIGFFLLVGLLLLRKFQSNIKRSTFSQSHENRIKALISANKLNEAFNQLKTIAKGAEQDELIHIENQYSQLIRDERAGIINSEDVFNMKNQLRLSLLNFADRVEKGQ